LSRSKPYFYYDGHIADRQGALDWFSRVLADADNANAGGRAGIAEAAGDEDARAERQAQSPEIYLNFSAGVDSKGEFLEPTQKLYQKFLSSFKEHVLRNKDV
jgi:hypothetical protein